MANSKNIPDNPLQFIKDCIKRRRIFWTYHVNMRLGERSLTRERILNAVDSFEINEQYPKDKYLPSYLIRAEAGEVVFHVQIAGDVAGENVRIVTAYVPDSREWHKDLRTRRERS
jgi:hypothetical protein